MSQQRHDDRNIKNRIVWDISSSVWLMVITQADKMEMIGKM